MTIGRTDDPGNPSHAPALEAATVFGSGSRNPSGPAAMMPRQQAGHMIALDPNVEFLALALASKGPSTHAWGFTTDGALPAAPLADPPAGWRSPDRCKGSCHAMQAAWRVRTRWTHDARRGICVRIRCGWGGRSRPWPAWPLPAATQVHGVLACRISAEAAGRRGRVLVRRHGCNGRVSSGSRYNPFVSFAPLARWQSLDETRLAGGRRPALPRCWGGRPHGIACHSWGCCNNQDGSRP